MVKVFWEVIQKVKKTWKSPELIILIKGRPEERVLSCCKTDTITGPTSNLGNCVVNGQHCNPCEKLGPCS